MIIGGGCCYPTTMQNINIVPPTSISSLYKRELPDSQDSFLSVASSTFSAPPLPSTSSNLSTTSTTASSTDLTSPASSIVPSSQSQQLEQILLPSTTQARVRDTQLNAPRLDTAVVNALRTGNTAASPMSLDSPVNQGFKRSADGTVKGAEIPIGNASAPPAAAAAHKRNKSMDSHSSTRIGELSGKLKARLSYAMVKVQNGWEKQSLEELEESHSQRGSPISAPSRSDGSRLTFDSPTSVERRRRPSGVSENSDHVMISPGQSTPSNPSRSLATTPSSHWRPATKPAMNAAVNLISVTLEDGAGLAPAPEFAARRKRRSSASHVPPPLLGSSQRKVYSDLGATPRTPATPRAGILRMPSQQAEKDAVDTLLFMSSPNNSSRVPYNSQAAPSPLRPDAPQRRVMFENHPIKERSGAYEPPMPAPANHHTTYYQTDAAR